MSVFSAYDVKLLRMQAHFLQLDANFCFYMYMKMYATKTSDLSLYLGGFFCQLEEYIFWGTGSLGLGIKLIGGLCLVQGVSLNAALCNKGPSVLISNAQLFFEAQFGFFSPSFYCFFFYRAVTFCGCVVCSVDKVLTVYKTACEQVCHTTEVPTTDLLSAVLFIIQQVKKLGQFETLLCHGADVDAVTSGREQLIEGRTHRG